jgi:hypothetical protein
MAVILRTSLGKLLSNPRLIRIVKSPSADECFMADLHKREIDFRVLVDLLSDKTWIATLYSVYGTVPGPGDRPERTTD